jgi:hypothetical protein
VAGCEASDGRGKGPRHRNASSAASFMVSHLFVQSLRVSIMHVCKERPELQILGFAVLTACATTCGIATMSHRWPLGGHRTGIAFRYCWRLWYARLAQVQSLHVVTTRCVVAAGLNGCLQRGRTRNITANVRGLKTAAIRAASYRVNQESVTYQRFYSRYDNAPVATSSSS